VYFLILTSIIKTKLDWHKIFKVSVFVGFLSILFAYGQRLQLGKFFVGWQHGERVIGTIGNPALFAGYLLFIIYLSILMTAVRGAILSLFLTLFLLALFLIFFSKKKKIKMGLLILIIVFVLLFVFAFIAKDKPFIKNISWLNKITNISSDTDTVQTRIWSWTSAFEGWKERPVFGWGPENFAILHMKHFNARHFTHIGSETIWDRAHNVLINTLATMGIIGLLSYLFIFFSIFYVLIKKLKKKKIGKITFAVFSAMILAYVGQNLFIFDTFANYFLFFLVLGYINYLNIDKKDIELKQEKVPSIFLMIILLILSLVLVFQTNIKPSQANYAATRAILAGRAGNAQKAIDKYQEALNCKTTEQGFDCKTNSQGAYEIRHKLATFAIQLTENMRQKNKEMDPSLLYFTIQRVGENIEKFPLDTIPYLYVSRMYIILINKNDEQAGEQALLAVNKALDLNKNNPRIWYELGQAQMSLQKHEQAYESFKTAAELNPEVSLSWWFTAVAANKAGEYEQAIEYLNKALELGYTNFQNSITDLMRMVQIYEKVQRYDMVVKTYELAIQESPGNAQIYASLAVAYAKIGDFEKARQAAEQAAALDPKFEEESKIFINSL